MYISYNDTEKQNQRNKNDVIFLSKNQEKELDSKRFENVEKDNEKHASPDGTRKLQDEINMLTKRNCELESQLRNLEAGHSKDVHIDTMDGVDNGE